MSRMQMKLSEICDELEKLDKARTQGEMRHEFTDNKGHTVWVKDTRYGSMQVAVFGYAGFDETNSKLCAASANHMPVLLKAARLLLTLKSYFATIESIADINHQARIARIAQGGYEEIRKLTEGE